MQESLFIQYKNHQLHLRHIQNTSSGTPVLMIHGSIENGLIFYTEKGKGLACYLAEQGFDVYVADLRGRGKSIPAIDKYSLHGQYESINEDIPALINYIHNKTHQKLHVICHSWGGVLTASCMARYPEISDKVYSKICFGTKRTIAIKSIEKFYKINVMWNIIAPMIIKRKGYFDAKAYNFGSDSETENSLKHSIAWVNKSEWVDPLDGYNYFEATKQVEWPATWHITGVNDSLLGHPKDVARFIEESNNINAKFSILSKENGNKIDYSHIDILTHPLAVSDHFPQVTQWLKEHTT